MARAVLEIVGDASGVVAALAKTRAASKSAAAAVAADSRASARVQSVSAEQAAKATERAAKMGLRAQLDAMRQTANAAKLSTKARAEAEKQATEIASREARARGLSAAQELDLRKRALSSLTTMHLAAERAMTAASQQEAAKRARQARTIGSGLRAVGGAAMSAGSTIHGEIQATRRRRAGTESTLNDALYQANIAGPQAASMRSQVMQFANARGMDPQAIADGILQAQTQFSVLAQDGVSPQQALQQQLSLAEFAQNTRQDPGEVMRVAGMLGQQGIQGADQRAAIMQMTGMAHAGSIELANMTREAMGPLMQNIARSVNANMSPQERAAAVRSATMETMAVGEVTARSGGRSRDMLNALAKTRGSITNERTQENLYARLQGGGEQERALAARMFTMRDGHARLNEGTTAVGFLSQIVAGLGGDANRASNLLGSGGAGRPMTLTDPQRRLMLLLASQGTGGHTIAENVERMQTDGLRFDEARVQQGREMVQGETATQLQRDENARSEALGNNTSALNQLSNAIASAAAGSPIASAGLTAGGGLLGSLAAGRTGAAAAPLLGRAAGALGAGVAGAGAGTVGAGVAAALGVAGGAGYGINRAMGHRQESDNPFNSRFYTEFGQAVSLAIREGLSVATVRVDPHAATQAAAEASTRLPRR